SNDSPRNASLMAHTPCTAGIPPSRPQRARGRSSNVSPNTIKTSSDRLSKGHVSTDRIPGNPFHEKVGNTGRFKCDAKTQLFGRLLAPRTKAETSAVRD